MDPPFARVTARTPALSLIAFNLLASLVPASRTFTVSAFESPSAAQCSAVRPSESCSSVN